MNVPCPNVIDCPGSDFPVSNFSSEAPDRELFVGINWGWGWNLPPLGSFWSHSNCLTFCESSISQEDADLCAARENLLCVNSPGGDPATGDGGGGPPPFCQVLPQFCAPLFPGTQTYFNDTQTCSYRCPDGTVNFYTVLAGKFAATSKAQANAMAFSYACNVVKQIAICLGSLFDWSCVGDEINQPILILRGNRPPYVFSVVSGELPAGLVLTPDGVVTGIPNTPGAYVFTVQATGADGSSVQKTYTIDILGITNTHLADGTIGTAYSAQLLTSGTTGTVSFVASGSFPSGMTLHDDGLIDGTPTTAGDYSFDVTITDSILRSCTQVVTLTVKGPSCMDWNTLPWGTTFTAFVGAGFGGFTPDNATGSVFSIIAGAPNGFVDKASVQNTALIMYSGPACNCNLEIVLSRVGDKSRLCGGVFMTIGLSLLLNIDMITIVADGTYNYPFALPDCTVTPKAIHVIVSAQAPCGAGFPAGLNAITFDGTFTNI